MQHKLNKAQKRSPVQISNLLCDGVRNYFFNHVLACTERKLAEQYMHFISWSFLQCSLS